MTFYFYVLIHILAGTWFAWCHFEFLKW